MGDDNKWSVMEIMLIRCRHAESIHRHIIYQILLLCVKYWFKQNLTRQYFPILLFLHYSTIQY